MRLWTLQPVEYYDSCKGIIKPDPTHMELLNSDWEMKFQYDWMCDQMRKRLPYYNGGYPVWFYTEKPDMRHSHWGPRGSREVRLECEVPDELVLISDHDLWHFPMNWGYIPTSEEDDDEFDRLEQEIMGPIAGRELPNGKVRWIPRWDLTLENFDSVYDYTQYCFLRDKVLDSWERIFPDRRGEISDSGYMGTDNPFWQATVEELPKEWIVSESYHTLR